jgi:hypothetical protein
MGDSYWMCITKKVLVILITLSGNGGRSNSLAGLPIDGVEPRVCEGDFSLFSVRGKAGPFG